MERTRLGNVFLSLHPRSNIHNIKYIKISVLFFIMKQEILQHVFFKRELVVLYLNLSRTTQIENITAISKRFSNVLFLLKQNIQNTQKENQTEWTTYLKLFYSLMAQTRMEKGEREMTYACILTLYSHYPILAIHFIHTLVGEQGIGCWADMKYLCEHVYTHTGNKTHAIIETCVALYNAQLRKDYTEIQTYTDAPQISNVAKWIPREYKRFHWLYTQLVENWFSIDPHCEYINTYKKRYRKVVARVSPHLDITQTKQCSQSFNTIIPENVTKTTLCKQPCLFYSQSKSSITENREPCYNKCIEYATQKKRKHVTEHPYGIFQKTKTEIAPLIKEAFVLLNMNPEDKRENYTRRIKVLNEEWRRIQKSVKKGSQKCIIPVLDVSHSMQYNDSTPYYTAIGFAILLSNLQGKRILTIDNMPCWINLENADTLMEQIERIDFYTKSYNATVSNICSSIDVIVYSMQNIEQDDSYENNIQIVILSDFDKCTNIEHVLEDETPTLYDEIVNRFTIQYTNVVLETMPQIVFWNMGNRKLIDLPTHVFQPNTQILSGSSIDTIKHLHLFSSHTPYDGIVSILSNSKYDRFNEYIEICGNV